MGKSVNSMSAAAEGYGDPAFLRLLQLNPLYMVVTKNAAAYVNVGSFKLSSACPNVGQAHQATGDIIEANRIGAKPNVMYYLTKDGSFEFLSLRNGVCHIQGKIKVGEPIPNHMTLQIGLYLLVWPDKTKNRFLMFDLKCSLL